MSWISKVVHHSSSTSQYLLFKSAKSSLSNRLFMSSASSAPHHLVLQQEELKGPLVVRSIPTVSPEPYQIQVRVKAAALNPLDYKQFALGYVTQNFPYIGGGDLGGIVTEVGAEVKHLKVGDRVSNAVFQTFETMAAAAFQEYSSADANIAVKIPESVSFAQASTISVTWFTAIVGLCHPTALNLQWPGTPFPKSDAPPEASQPILVWGAGSGVGRAVVQVLVAAGYTNVIATAAPNRFEDVKSLGAKEVFNYHDEDVVEKIKAYVGKDILLGFDPIATPSSLLPLSKVIAKGGRLATVTPQGQDIIPFEGGDITRVRVYLPMLLDRKNTEARAFGRKAAEHLESTLVDGSYSFISHQELPGGLSGGGVQKGSDMLRLNQNHGDKIVVVDI